MRRKLLVTRLLTGGALAYALVAHGRKPPAYSDPVFEDVTRQSGLTVPHLSSPDKRYVIEFHASDTRFMEL